MIGDGPGTGEVSWDASSEASSTGLHPHGAAALAYLAWWLSGLTVLLVERESRYVRFHALQATLGLGGIWAAGLTVWLLAFASIFVSALGFRYLIALAYLTWLLGVVVWALCLFKAYGGKWWKLPLVGEYAFRKSALVVTD